jgi:hypothetical protein
MKKLFVLIVAFVFCNGCSMLGGGSPTDVFKAFATAARKKDGAAMKSYLSQETLSNVKKSTVSLKKSEDEVLAEAADKFDIADTSNEKIAADGKSASLDYTTKLVKEVQTVNFIKEGSWKIHFGKPRTADDLAKDSKDESSTDADSSSSSSSTPSDTSPVTISASSLVSDAMGGSSGMDKYRGRMITVTDAELWEVQSNMLHIGTRGGSYSSGYIICKGSFSDYMPYASKISELRKQYKSPGATIKGSFSEVVTDSGYTQVHLSPCVLSNLEK